MSFPRPFHQHPIVLPCPPGTVRVQVQGQAQQPPLRPHPQLPHPSPPPSASAPTVAVPITAGPSPSSSVTSVSAVSPAPKSMESPCTAILSDAKMESQMELPPLLPPPPPSISAAMQELKRLSLEDNPSRLCPHPQSPAVPAPAAAAPVAEPTVAAIAPTSPPSTTTTHVSEAPVLRTTDFDDSKDIEDDPDWVAVDLYRFSCPYCKGTIEVQRQDVRCGIFRHAQYHNGILIDPHCPESTMKQLLAQKLVIGCGNPFKLLETRTGGKRAVKCPWI